MIELLSERAYGLYEVLYDVMGTPEETVWATKYAVEIGVDPMEDAWDDFVDAVRDWIYFRDIGQYDIQYSQDSVWDSEWESVNERVRNAEMKLS